MTMVFRTVKQHLVKILEDNAAGRFRVQSYQPQRDSSEGCVDNDQIVRVFYESGDFPKKGSNWTGPADHEMKFTIHLIVSRGAEGDLTTLNDPNATPAELATAMADFRNAAAVCDDDTDELIDIVYQILMDNRYIQLDDSVDVDGSGDLDLTDRWIASVQKSEPIPQGQYVTLEAYLQYTIDSYEEFTGADALGTADTEAVDVDIRVEDDENEGRAGVIAPPSE